MDDELKQLENELRRLTPAAPSPELLARIDRDLAVSALEAGPAADALRKRAGFGPWWWWIAGALPAAAAVAFLLARRPTVSDVSAGTTEAPGATAEQTALKPVAAENLLVAAQDEGLVTLDDGTPARRARLHYLDTITWKNPRTNASLTWTVPREEVRVVPVTFQ
jgi:anti-sigma-K factor RskA